MKQALTLTKNSNQQHGFTLVETAIAMGMVAVMISGFMIAFGPAVQGINKSISVKEASRLSSALEFELSVVRTARPHPNDVGDTPYGTAFEKAFNWIRDSGTKATAVLVYQYRGNPNTVNPDGTLAPYTLAMAQAYETANGEPPAPGNQYVIQTAVRRLSDNDTVSAELAPGVLQGQVYYVKMQQFIYYDWPLGDIVFELVVAGENENGLPVNPRAPGGLGQIIDPTEDENGDRDTVTGHGDYPEAVISCRAQFYALPNVLYSYINGASFSLADADNNGHPDTTGKPVYTRNIAVSR